MHRASLEELARDLALDLRTETSVPGIGLSSDNCPRPVQFGALSCPVWGHSTFGSVCNLLLADGTCPFASLFLDTFSLGNSGVRFHTVRLTGEEIPDVRSTTNPPAAARGLRMRRRESHGLVRPLLHEQRLGQRASGHVEDPISHLDTDGELRYLSQRSRLTTRLGALGSGAASAFYPSKGQSLAGRL